MIRLEDTPLHAHDHCQVVVTDGITEGTVPVHVIVGQRHHPCLGLVAGVHGDEYDGIIALHEIARELHAAELPGSLIIVPVANPFAFTAAQRRTPQDNKDINRVFPGRDDGSLSERLAYELCAHVLYQVDLALTLHGGGARTTLAPWVEYLDVPGSLGEATYAAARASGFPDLIALSALPGRLLTAMEKFGVPLIEGEVGGRATTRREDVDYYKERVYDVARHAGVVAMERATPHPEPALWHLSSVQANATGIFLRAVELHQAIGKGELLGTIMDMHGATAATLSAPASGMIGAYTGHVGVQAGDNVITLWVPAPPREQTTI